MAINRFGASSLHQRDSRSALFDGYTGDGARRPVSASPSRGYGYGGYGAPASNGGLDANGGKGFRPATPNRRGQYSDAVLNELESQNDAQVEGILGKVKILKTVSLPLVVTYHATQPGHYQRNHLRRHGVLVPLDM